MNSSEKFWNAVFMCTTTRTAGFNSINVGELNAGMLTLLIGFMYLAAVPVVVAVRYSDQSLKPLRQRSVASLVPDMQGQMLASELRGGNTVRTQTKSFLTQNVLWIFLVWAVICIIQAPEIGTDPHFTSFGVLFEIISGFGGVGLSLGYPTINASFSAVWAPGSKFLLVTVIFLGRLRGMPSSIDRAVKFLPQTARVTRVGVRFRVPGARTTPTGSGDGQYSRRRAPAYTTFIMRSRHQDVLTTPGQVVLTTLPELPPTHPLDDFHGGSSSESAGQASDHGSDYGRFGEI